MIRAEGLKKKYGDNVVFDGVDITINDGDIVGIIGPSGTGKSLLLRYLMMLDRPDEGRIFLNDAEITDPDADLEDAHKKIGMVFQEFNLFSHLSVIENVISGMLHLQKQDPETAFDYAMKMLRLVGLADKAYAYPATLSSGQKQRAAIARTLAMKPEIILMDEPTSSLDPNVRGEVEAVIRLTAAQGHTMVISSHEMALIRSICSKVIFFCDGKVHEEGTPAEIFDDPKRPETRRFIRALRVLEFDIRSRDFDFIGMQTVISDFAGRNGIDKMLTERLQSIMEELCQMAIIQPEDDNKMRITFEYNPGEASLSGNVIFSGRRVDPDDPLYFFSWPIIEKRATEVSAEGIDEDGYTNRIKIIIR